MNEFSIIFYILVVFVIFLLLREFWAWYFKINKLIDILNKIEHHLNPSPEKKEKVEKIICPECGFENKPGANYCEKCGVNI